MKKLIAAVICLFVLVSCANAHLFRRARVQYVVVDPCGCVEMQVDEERGTVSATKIERKIEFKRERVKRVPTIQEFPPVIEDAPAPTNDLPAEEPKSEPEKKSILVMAGDLPVTK